jgi:signal transduction histidine kinase
MIPTSHPPVSDRGLSRTPPRSLPWGSLYLRFTAVLLATLLAFGVTVLALHGVALARATTAARLEGLRLVADAAARHPEATSLAVAPSPLVRIAIVGPDGASATREPLPAWVPVVAARTAPGEFCGRLGGPCYAVRRVALAGGHGTLVAYYRPSTSSFWAPLSLALALSVALWLAVSGAVGLLLLSHLRRADEGRRRLIAGLAHDLGTPLTSIRGFAETRLLEEGAAAEERRSWTVVYRESLRMQRLVEDMLVLSRWEAQRLSLSLGEIDLRELVQEAAERAHLAHGCAPALALPEAPARARVDRDRIDQLLANLVDNAYRHGRGQDVVLSLEAVGAGWCLEVRDHGPGLSPRARQGLFEPFHRGDGSGGSGLGLAIAREIAARHGGSLRVEDAPGGGCRAVFHLPLGEATGG